MRAACKTSEYHFIQADSKKKNSFKEKWGNVSLFKSGYFKSNFLQNNQSLFAGESYMITWFLYYITNQIFSKKIYWVLEKLFFGVI